MKHYELTYIISTNLTEVDYPKIESEIKDLLTSNGAEITSEDNLGRRKLVFPIKKIRHGLFQVLEFDLDPNKLKKIDHELMLNADILRYLMIVKKKLTEKEKKAAERLARTQGSPEKQKADQAAATRVMRTTGIRESSRISKRKDEDKVRLEDLDEKLDEILDQDIMK